MRGVFINVLTYTDAIVDSLYDLRQQDLQHNEYSIKIARQRQ